jgi:hypothetical protein
MSAKTVKSGLDKLALDLLARADAAESLHDRVDIFKAVSAFHIATAKVAKGQPSEDETRATFGAIRQKVNGVQTMEKS